MRSPLSVYEGWPLSGPVALRTGTELGPMPPRGGFGLSLSSGRDVKPRREDRPAGGLLARRLGYLLQAPYPPRVHPMCTPPVSQPGKPVLREERYGIF